MFPLIIPFQSPVKPFPIHTYKYKMYFTSNNKVRSDRPGGWEESARYLYLFGLEKRDHNLLTQSGSTVNTDTLLQTIHLVLEPDKNS